MKKLLSISLAILFIAQTLMNVGIGIYYHINKEYISQKLCENRNNPAIHCNGHCFLSKQLKKAEEREQKSSSVLKDKEEVISTEAEFIPFKSFLSVSTSRFFVGYKTKLFLQPHSYGIIKPPETV